VRQVLDGGPERWLLLRLDEKHSVASDDDALTMNGEGVVKVGT
jgi:hypothetical protein